mmetsp:Transcript_18389/g.22823  ORF Transcript_18389/g.22823 Transcript_18389/m.22823 type:complete len:465 (+) Transcript_18389:129-1523(+)|eukprot:CAMPEP_0172506272 /NCGR_PEP_ID=MMETSP1066-20121228/193363_1 /TAXON_ID=671091 /ORGANISM="Coscinodiscus wailesii, Strain CCMP2513" /LENGTH=464 /DNA_ID=CAMNT_0013283223 /DNA_START=128 /DNA_END=1522 /DNA_ORIENTATION=+
MSNVNNTEVSVPSRDFLSGEPQLDKTTKQQQQRMTTPLLGSMLHDLSLYDDKSGGTGSSAAKSDARQESECYKSKTTRPLIQVLDDTPDNVVATASSDNETQHAENNSAINDYDDNNTPPPPLSFSDDDVISGTTSRTGATVETTPSSSGGFDDAFTKYSDESSPSLMEIMMADAKKARDKKQVQLRERERQRAQKGFLSREKTKGGFRKGFLLNAASGDERKVKKRLKKKEKGDNNDIYELDSNGNLTKVSEETPITVKKPPNSNKNLQFPQNDNPLFNVLNNNNQWATSPDFINTISQNPILSKGLTNSKFTAALEALRSNPKRAMEQFRHHPDVTEFLNEFCNVLGDHFTKLGEAEEAKKVTKDGCWGPLVQEAMKKRKAMEQDKTSLSWDANLTEEERQKIDDVVKNEELTQLLMDADLQRVIQECGKVPGRMRYYLADSTGYGPKLRRLIDAGLLQVAR